MKNVSFYITNILALKEDIQARKYLSSLSEDKKISFMHSFFQGKLNSECIKFMKCLIKLNKKVKNKNAFGKIIELVDTEYFTKEVKSDFRHHKLSVDHFEYFDYDISWRDHSSVRIIYLILLGC